jgi:ubiquinone/menaquinone biosynthesis C-methylase UbiE
MSLEQDYVYKTYDVIADHFSETRFSVWQNVKIFLNSVKSGSLIADIGCGNGKNMFRPDCVFHGLDTCQKFVNICNSKGLDTRVGNCTDIPFNTNTYNATICIAVVHHLSKIKDRKKCIQELIRITKPDGKILIQVWEYNRDKHNSQDEMIPWTLQEKFKKSDDEQIYKRFYHLFCEDELKDLVLGEDVIIDKYYNSCGNWCIELIKK